MKMTVAKALVSHQALQQLGQTKWPFQASMVIAKNKAELTEIGKEYEKRRQELVKKYGKVPETGGQPQVPPESVDKFTEEVMALQDEELNLDLKTVSLVELRGSKKEDPEIEPNVLEPLTWMFTMVGQKPSRGKRK